MRCLKSQQFNSFERKKNWGKNQKIVFFKNKKIKKNEKKNYNVILEFFLGIKILSMNSTPDSRHRCCLEYSTTPLWNAKLRRMHLIIPFLFLRGLLFNSGIPNYYHFNLSVRKRYAKRASCCCQPHPGFSHFFFSLCIILFWWGILFKYLSLKEPLVFSLARKFFIPLRLLAKMTLSIMTNFNILFACRIQGQDEPRKFLIRSIG